MQYSAVQYSTEQCSAVQYNTIQYNTIQYNTLQYNTIHYTTLQYNTYRKSYERECISWFMGTSDVLKVLKIARAVTINHEMHEQVHTIFYLLYSQQNYSHTLLCRRCQGGKRPGGEKGSPLLGQCVMRRKTGTSAPSALPVQLMAAKNLLSTNRKWHFISLFLSYQ